MLCLNSPTNAGTVSQVVEPFSNTKSFRTDGIDQYFDFGNDIPAIESATEFSLVGWYKYEKAGNGRAYLFGQWENASSPDTNIYCYYDHANTDLGLNMNNGLAWRNQNMTAIVKGVWFHIAVTYKGSSPSTDRMKVYINGNLITRESGTARSVSSTSSTAPFLICMQDTPVDFGWQGNVDEFAIYEIELSQTQVTEIYGAGQAVDLKSLTTKNDLANWWRFGDDRQDSAVGGTGFIKDQVSNINGTPINTASGDCVLDVPPTFIPSLQFDDERNSQYLSLIA